MLEKIFKICEKNNCYILIDEAYHLFYKSSQIKKINTYKKVDVFVKIDSKTFTSDDYNIIQQLSEILDDSGAVGAFELGNLFINIKEYKTYTEKLINL